MPEPSPDTWLPTDLDPVSTATRLVGLLLVMGLAFLCAVAFRAVVRRGRERSGAVVRQLIGRPMPAPWESGGWACGRCHSVNRTTDRACARCRTPRAEAEMSFAAVATEPDIIPASIPAGAGSVVTLEHNAAAHADALNGHWRLRVNSVIVGAAARRDGAVALLRAVDGADAVLFDARGEGYTAYSLPALIAAFESPRLPLRTPCPEGTP